MKTSFHIVKCILPIFFVFISTAVYGSTLERSLNTKRLRDNVKDAKKHADSTKERVEQNEKSLDGALNDLQKKENALQTALSDIDSLRPIKREREKLKSLYKGELERVGNLVQNNDPKGNLTRLKQEFPELKTVDELYDAWEEKKAGYKKRIDSTEVDNKIKDSERMIRQASEAIQQLKFQALTYRKSLMTSQEDQNKALKDLKEALYEWSKEIRPPYLQTIDLTANGASFYHAIWKEDTKEKEELEEKIEKMKNVLDEMQELDKKIQKRRNQLIDMVELAKDGVKSTAKAVREMEGDQSDASFLIDAIMLVASLGEAAPEMFASKGYSLAADMALQAGKKIAGDLITYTASKEIERFLGKPAPYPGPKQMRSPKKQGKDLPMKDVLEKDAQWEDVVDSAFKAEGLEDLDVIKGLISNKTWLNSIKNQAEKYVEALGSQGRIVVEKSFRGILTGMLKDGVMTAGLGITFEMIKTMTAAEVEKTILDILKKSPGKIGDTALKGAMNSVGKDMLLYYFMGQHIEKSKKLLLVEQTYYNMLEYFLDQFEYAQLHLELKIWEGNNVIAELANEVFYFKSQKREAVKDEKKLEENTTYQLKLVFSHPVKIVKAAIGDKVVPFKGKEFKNVWEGNIHIKTFKDSEIDKGNIPFVVDVKDEGDQQLDSKAESIALHDFDSESGWTGYEPGEDRFHKFPFKKPKVALKRRLNIIIQWMP